MKNTLNFICEFVSEAVSIKKLLVILILLPSMVFSQEINDLKNIESLDQMSDKDLIEYWDQAQKRGYSLDQIKTLARAQGASESDILEFENRIKKIKPNEKTENGDLNETQNEISSIFGLNIKENKDDQDEEKVSVFTDLGIFGSSFFNNPNINSSPQLNIATPSSYELGPGDELTVSIWGAAENEYNSVISREGYLKIERIGPVYLSGLTISEAKIKLKSRLSKIYSGINSNVNKVFFDLSLLNTRSIIINIAGNVTAPGTYTLSSLTSPLNAIYAAGGPSENGSYREINIIRGGEKVHSIDLYDYFVKGQLKSFSLRDQDVIVVPTYKNRVFLKGEFKKDGIYELKENETISDLLFFNGGISSFGVKNEIYVQTIQGINKSVKTVNKDYFKKHILKDGDIVEARKVSDEFTNIVSVEGAVMIPGQYELDKTKDVQMLVEKAGGLKRNALKTRAYLIREVDGFQQEVKTIDLVSENYELRNNDKLVIASIEQLTPEKYITIDGEVSNPGLFPFFKGMTIVDLILMSGGVNDKGSNNAITVYRSTYDETMQNPVETITVDLNDEYDNLSSSQNIELYKNDLIIVRTKAGYQSVGFVSVEGLVKSPGNYAIKNNKYSVFDIINDFGGFLPDAELNGIKIKRPVDVKKLEELATDSLEIEIDEFIEIGLNIEKILKSNGSLDQYNLVLKNGDQIIVPKADNSIEVSGEVQKPTAITYYRGLSSISAVNKSGGFTTDAKRSRLYVVYQNGDIGSTKKFLFFNNYPKLLPGSKIFIPKKPESKSTTSVGEIVGYTTSLVSIFALIKSL
jgi:protein involved in polysaccharide export with SLBB domain